MSYKQMVLSLWTTAHEFRMAGDSVEARYWLAHLMRLRVTSNYDR
jgi:hypothetical protein